MNLTSDKVRLQVCLRILQNMDVQIGKTNFIQNIYQHICLIKIAHIQPYRYELHSNILNYIWVLICHDMTDSYYILLSSICTCPILNRQNSKIYFVTAFFIVKKRWRFHYYHVCSFNKPKNENPSNIFECYWQVKHLERLILRHAMKDVWL